jgi:Saccharopine dehydrogenase NADP binding domain
MAPECRVTVLVLGGYGVFGTRLCRLLADDRRLHVIVAGRRKDSAAALTEQLRFVGPATFAAAELDGSALSLTSDHDGRSPAIVVNLCGPFQQQSYAIAEACIAARAHYIDMADARDFVCGIGRLDAAAKAADVLVTAGASSVPALSAAVIEHLAPRFSRLDTIAIGISPGNRTERGRATVESILSYCGEPVRVWKDGRWVEQHAWTRQLMHPYPAPVGRRWLTLCDVPDLSLLPKRYPQVRSVVFRAGLELPVLHFGLAMLAKARQLRLLPNLARFASPLHWTADRMRRFGSDCGAMHVDLAGEGIAGGRLALRWTLLATSGDGPYVPTLATAALVGRLVSGSLTVRGARPCLGLLQLHDFSAGMNRLSIKTHVETL